MGTPFENYADRYAGVSGETIRLSAAHPSMHATSLQGLADELDGDGRRIVRSIEGDAQTTVAANPRMAASSAQALAAKGQYAVGLLNDYANMVDILDQEIDRLNDEYRTKLAAHQPVSFKTGDVMFDQALQVGRLPNANVDISVLRRLVTSELRPQARQAWADLDDGAETIATRFRQGATTENVRHLVLHGMIPLAAASLYPSLRLSAAERRQANEASGHNLAKKTGTVSDLFGAGAQPWEHVRIVKWASRFADGLSGVAAAWEQWDADANNPATDVAERLDRSVTRGVLVTAGSLTAGAEGGMWAGGAIGTAICPGLGTLVGGVVGGVVGGAVGAWGGGEAADWLNDKTDGVVHAAGDAVDGVKDAGGWVGDKLGLW